MNKLAIIMTALVSVSAAGLLPMAAPASGPAEGAHPAPSSCSAVPVSAPRGAHVESVTAQAYPAGTVTFPEATPPLQTLAPIPDVPARCEITVTLTHGRAGDHETVKVALPQDRAAWSGRFQATGGSAYLAGDLGATLVAAVKNGYAAAATDAGIGQSPADVSGWALTPDGRVNGPLLENFASRSVHDLAVVGKSVTKEFYGHKATYSYWNGCSTGGRQGYVAAQEYPTDFQGILAGAPAVSWDRFAVATLWPQVVFNEEDVAPAPCELEAFNTAAVEACDTADGVRDGVIDDPRDCRWDPRELVGTQVDCDGATHTITAQLADAVRKIWQGPVSSSGRPLWYGPNKGAAFSWLATPGKPFVVADQWVKYFVAKDPGLDTTNLTYRQFDRLFATSQRDFHAVIGSDDPDLSAFARSGGKLLSWHGQADQLVPTQGTVDYRERVNRAMGGNARVDSFYRLFLPPGVDHCGIGTDPLGSLVEWVEQGHAPATLPAVVTDGDGNTVTREVCRYPQVTRRVGTDVRCVSGSASTR
ncbi:tannase/feruloyl esterase family alpha/beta hydrolase [Promicromonospora sukumoe]|uniref:tannase/feruloyl esterase family alpha/beta hydrolase n=1 Tax=Promicromonospora sukumoe TaxID=88382 RepID=UPI00039C0702|nr:tannase/feruloyl esterase family alpha/beta hydrolase [Promicromonospora sukumoe]